VEGFELILAYFALVVAMVWIVLRLEIFKDILDFALWHIVIKRDKRLLDGVIKSILHQIDVSTLGQRT
jgi:hypothetical protein